MEKKVLVIDDEKNMRWAIKNALDKEGYMVLEASNGKEGLKMVESTSPDLILLDLRMPVLDGIETLKKIKKDNKELDTPVIILTAHGTMELAVEAMKLGALDFISKPFELERLKILIRNALNITHLRNQVSYLKEELKSINGGKIIAESPKMEQVLKTVTAVANTNATVLILGESGTGKEVIANAIHYSSDRKEKPFVKVNCGAIPENLIESELFGHEKGAFTGAINRKIGKFERANGGSIFLDEVGELPLALQVKLLRVLQQKEFERVGGTDNIKVDIRIVAATNKELLKMVQEGTFREDLYYRLNVIPIKLPPLRERKEDIPHLIDYFLEKYCKELGKMNLQIKEEVYAKLIEYQWKGNIRELENLMERMVILCPRNLITEESIPPEITGFALKEDGTELPIDGVNLEDLERNLIKQALERTNHNQTQAAKLLGISRHTLLYRMEKHSLTKGNKS